MDKLPPEILHKIFIELIFERKLECMLVCRRWWNVLDKQSLFHSVYITDNRVFDRFMKIINSQPGRETQVESMALLSFFDNGYDKRELCGLFPNLKKISIIESIDDIKEIHSFCNAPMEPVKFKSRIKEITDYGECEFTRHLIFSNSCNQLKSLELNLWNTSEAKSIVIPHLKNMPVLEELILYDFDVNLFDIELLHQNLSSIRSLSLIDININTVGLLPHIEPNHSIKEFRSLVTTAMDKDSHIRWYQYLSKKYVSLESLRIDDQEFTNWASEYLDEIFIVGLLPLLQINAYSITNLRINALPSEVDLFEQLDSFGCRINVLRVESVGNSSALVNIGGSNQCQYIKDLSIWDTNIDSVDIFRNMKALTSLLLSWDRYETFEEEEEEEEEEYFFAGGIIIDELLYACPNSLESLTIKESALVFDPSQDYKSSINKLDMMYSRIPKELGDVISFCFPKLTTLVLRLDLRNNLELKLQNHHLSHVDIGSFRDSESFNISLVTDGGSKIRYFTSSNKGSDELGSKYHRGNLIAVPAQALDARPLLELHCASVKKMHLHFYELDLR